MRFSSPDKILYAISFFGCLFLLVGSRLNIRNRQRRALVLAAISGFLYLGIAIYGRLHLATLWQLSMVKSYYIIKGIAAGVSVALLLLIVRQQGHKTFLRVWSLLFVVFNVFIFTTHRFRNEYAFYTINANLVATMITLTILHFQQRTRIETVST